MNRKTLRACVALLGSAWLASCGATRPNKYYALEAPADVPVAGPTFPVSLLVGRVTAPHLYRDDRIVFRHASGEMGAYETQRWAEPPPDMIEAIVLRSLRASGKFRSVQNLRSNAHGSHVVRGRLAELSEVAEGSAVHSARVELEFELYDQEAGAVVWSHAYREEQAVTGGDFTGLVGTINSIVNHIVGQATSEIEQYFAKNPPKTK